MGYLHIDNLYKNQTVLAFRRCFALEKVHGTSAHIAWRDGKEKGATGRPVPLLVTWLLAEEAGPG